MKLPKAYSWTQVQIFWGVMKEFDSTVCVAYEDGEVGAVDERVRCECGAKAEWGDYLCRSCRIMTCSCVQLWIKDFLACGRVRSPLVCEPCRELAKRSSGN